MPYEVLLRGKLSDLSELSILGLVIANASFACLPRVNQ